MKPIRRYFACAVMAWALCLCYQLWAVSQESFPREHMARLCSRLHWLGIPKDDMNFPEPEDVPVRERDALIKFDQFVKETGCSTNQLLEGLFLIATNGVNAKEWFDPRDSVDLSETAILCLSEMNIPETHAFFSYYCTNALNVKIDREFGRIFHYSNFEPEVMAYMRSVCVMTNRYDLISDYISMEMEDTLDCIPAEYKPSATTNFCKYLYFVIGHTTQQMCAQDRVLARLMPPYSNSVQRVQAMNYVVNTATNAYQRAAAQRELARLSQLPTNALNDVSWLTEE